ncbi:hypothetical protein [Flavilitoribacter nigricans]|uniref:Translation elongation factor EFTu/EF1A C-terminal domain-containing protein n=1 Tax=Flavilitoribacter nigricans (strain ATCC 23147 / DSM 23189 / NBRC 102662 / NCIMB 1420 / SS-2) TaxID=1122177 RepID=A0A2D0NE49_FLAN2|nr:hypothetical protein [Flavilitoribacter nigricans]PHN06043.1 hypothetical protein CRP01_13820 [Flavilitoribacter nigricans DSM 23189 = NBRC 102662]
MTPEEFVKCFYLERQSLIDLYFAPGGNTQVASLIRNMQLDEVGTERLRELLLTVLDDAFYTVLLGLDGEAQIGNRQEAYTLLDEEQRELTGGEIEGFAWEYFHGFKYEADQNRSDFIAELRYRTTEEGGRQRPVRSGYRPHIRFPVDDMLTSGQQTFINRTVVYPGDRVYAEIEILAKDYFAGKLREGMRFEFSEGSRLMGTGKILRMVNLKLMAGG